MQPTMILNSVKVTLSLLDVTAESLAMVQSGSSLDFSLSFASLIDGTAVLLWHHKIAQILKLGIKFITNKLQVKH